MKVKERKLTNNKEETVDLNIDAFSPPKTPDGRLIETKALQSLISLTKKPWEQDHAIPVTKGEAEKYLQRMRTELSRVRTLLKNNRQQPKRFKMLCRRIDNFETHDELVLRITRTNSQEISEELEDAFRALGRAADDMKNSGE